MLQSCKIEIASSTSIKLQIEAVYCLFVHQLGVLGRGRPVSSCTCHAEQSRPSPSERGGSRVGEVERGSV